MLTKKLYNDILIAPASEGAELFIVSGYATSAMAARHLGMLEKKGIFIKIHIIVGMTAKDGISQANHEGFCELQKNGVHEFRYMPENQISVHTKAYAWRNREIAGAGFVGSANYTQMAFHSRQQEAMERSDSRKIVQHYQGLSKLALLCTDNNAQGLVKDNVEVLSGAARSSLTSSATRYVTCSLLSRDGVVARISGLNWGQRPGREKNQAYIRLTTAIAGSGFFPEVGHHFSVHTDDGCYILCARRQQHGKAIHSIQSNSILGEYFRRRLGVPSEDLVTTEHLREYGRTDVTFFKIDDENYSMDFSPPK